MKTRLFEFVAALYFKVLAAALGCVLLGLLGGVWLHGVLRAVDVAGSLVSAVLFAYLVHLWIIFARENRRRRPRGRRRVRIPPAATAR